MQYASVRPSTCQVKGRISSLVPFSTIWKRAGMGLLLACLELAFIGIFARLKRTFFLPYIFFHVLF